MFFHEKSRNPCFSIGFRENISPHLKTEHKLIPNLTIDGIRLIYENAN